MRAISLVKKIYFEFVGNVVKDAVTLGDVDNDGAHELVVGSETGNVCIFKGREKYQSISNLSFVSCLAVGDVLNKGKNSLVIITANGWCYVYEIPDITLTETKTEVSPGQARPVEEVDGQSHSSKTVPTASQAADSSLDIGEALSNKLKRTLRPTQKKKRPQLICIHKQRIPANTKNILLGDVDGDGNNEMVLGLTDRVVRSYRWIPDPTKPPNTPIEPTFLPDAPDKLFGKFAALNKWECANQIGSISLHHSGDGKPCLLVAQPGGTFMRIRCYMEENVSHEEAERPTGSCQSETSGSVDYQFLGITRMRNQNISTEIIGDLRSPANENLESRNSSVVSNESTSSAGTSGAKAEKGRPYAVATLDGTIMLVQDEVILWAIAVDHQVFALSKLDITGNGSDDIVACSWDGQTYILDQQKNSVRFHLEEPVQAFHSGWYNMSVNEPPVTALVYVTFKNSIVVYYDIPLKELVVKKFEPDLAKLSEVFINEDRNREQALEHVKSLDKKTKRDLVEYLLYNTKP